jgi:hypothetical protein
MSFRVSGGYEAIRYYKVIGRKARSMSSAESSGAT